MQNAPRIAEDFDTSPCEVSNFSFPKKRIWELDALRGFAVFMMVFDHFMYLLWSMFGPAWYGRKALRFSTAVYEMKLGEFLRALAGGEITGATGGGLNLCVFAKYYWSCAPRNVIHPIFLFIFFAICGVSCTFSRSNLKRGIMLLFVALLVSVVTYLFDESVFIHFGTLTFLAFCILFWELLKRLCAFCGDRAAKWVTAGVSAAVFLAVTLVFHLLPLSSVAEIPDAWGWLFASHPAWSTEYATSVSPGEFTGMIPWAALFFFGAAVGPLLYGKKRTLLPFLDKPAWKPLCFIGRHALLVYCLHQLVLIGVLAVVSYLWLTPGSFVVF